MVVLAEGETEERFLYILAEKYFNNDPFNLGINIFGCGGTNYKFYIKILQAANIPYFIFSDYDNTETKTKVNKQLKECGLNPEHCDILIDLNADIETYLLSSGYENELRTASHLFIPDWFSRDEMRVRQKENIENLDGDFGLRSFLKSYKAKLAPLYGKIISDLDDTRAYPPKIRELFDKIHQKLNLQA